MILDKRIERFIARHHVLTLATLDMEGYPYCSNIFYSYDADNVAFVFASSEDTDHAQHILLRGHAAASIVLESKVVGKLQGLQIVGSARRASEGDRAIYLAAFPYAAVMPLTLWRMKIEYMKFTDNRLGFGKKIEWSRE